MMLELLVRDDKIVRVETTVHDRVVDFEDIAGRAAPDEWSHEAPWEDCEGWEHETRKLGYWDHDGLEESRGYARTGWNDPNVLVELDDDTIVDKWGHTRRDGESKQVWLERVARIKRSALDQLVKWHSDGWYVWCACADYGDYSESVGGMYDDDGCSDYVEETVLEMRMEIAAQMESDGYTVENQPEPPSPYNRIDQERARIRRNLDMS